jgi:hypothetical protein
VFLAVPLAHWLSKSYLIRSYGEGKLKILPQGNPFSNIPYLSLIRNFYFN